VISCAAKPSTWSVSSSATAVATAPDGPGGCTTRCNACFHRRRCSWISKTFPRRGLRELHRRSRFEVRSAHRDHRPAKAQRARRVRPTRLELEGDFTRIEIESALKRKIRVIPVMMGNAKMPSAAELPESLRDLAKRQNLELSDRAWDDNCKRLSKAIEQAVAPQSAAGPESDAPASALDLGLEPKCCNIALRYRATATRSGSRFSTTKALRRVWFSAANRSSRLQSSLTKRGASQPARPRLRNLRRSSRLRAV